MLRSSAKTLNGSSDISDTIWLVGWTVLRNGFAESEFVGFSGLEGDNIDATGYLW